MDVSSLANYLISTKKNVDTLGTNITNHECHVVMGNESADLDSVISSLVMGYYTAHSLSKEKHGENVYVFSVINVTREDLLLRTESEFYLKENGIPLEHLICRDEIDLTGLHEKGNLRLTLVDHNDLAKSDVHLDSSITRVVDHHKRVRKLGPNDIIEVVGSCTTLVTPIVMEVLGNDATVCRLLYGTIVLDTVNFSEAAGLTTPKDLKSVKMLQLALSLDSDEVPNANTTSLFNALSHARSDVSRMTPDQILRKDRKDMICPGFSISIPSINMLSEKFLKLPSVLEAMKLFMTKRNVNAIVVLCKDIDDTGDVTRDIIVYSTAVDTTKEICKVLTASELNLELLQSSLKNKEEGHCSYKQKNIVLNRKYVFPLLESYFSKTEKATTKFAYRKCF